MENESNKLMYVRTEERSEPCNEIGYKTYLVSTHPNKEIRACIMITSPGNIDPVTLKPIMYCENHTVGAKGETVVGCSRTTPPHQSWEYRVHKAWFSDERKKCNSNCKEKAFAPTNDL